jgi:hypothetical protein
VSELAYDVDAIRGDIEDLNGSADIQEKRLDRLERAVYALANGAYEPVAAGAYAKSILDEGGT